MPTTVKQLCKDTYNFIRNNLNCVVILVLVSTSIHTLIALPALWKIEEIMNLVGQESAGNVLVNMITRMSIDQQRSFLFNMIVVLLAYLIAQTIITSSTLSLLRNSSQGKYLKIIDIYKSAKINFLRIFLVITFYIVLTQLGLWVFFIPGLLIGTMLAFLPILYTESIKTSFLYCIKNSLILSNKYISLIYPVLILIIFKIILRILFFFIASKFGKIHPTLFVVFTSLTESIASVILLTYVFRLYMLLRKS